MLSFEKRNYNTGYSTYTFLEELQEFLVGWVKNLLVSIMLFASCPTVPFENILEGIRSGSILFYQVLSESWSEKNRNRQQGTGNRWREPGPGKHQCVCFPAYTLMIGLPCGALHSFSLPFFAIPDISSAVLSFASICP